MRYTELEARIDFLVLPPVPLGEVIEKPTLKRRGGTLNFKADKFRSAYCEKNAVVPMIPEYNQRRKTEAEVDSNYFIFDSENSECSSYEDQPDIVEYLELELIDEVDHTDLE